jgi:NADH:ubiquinone oxidoreductase subunit 3 (subunit A)
MLFIFILIILVLGFFGFVIASLIAMKEPSKKRVERLLAKQAEDLAVARALYRAESPPPTEEQLVEQAATALRIQRAAEQRLAND